MDLEGLRERNIPQQASSPDDAKKAVEELNCQKGDGVKEMKTYGRTPDGTGQFENLDAPYKDSRPAVLSMFALEKPEVPTPCRHVLLLSSPSCQVLTTL